MTKDCNHHWVSIWSGESLNQTIIKYKCVKCNKRYEERIDIFNKIKKVRGI